MRRIAYPYGRYLIEDLDVSFVGPKLKGFVTGLGLPVVKFDTQNEGDGTLIIAVNKTVKQFLKQEKPPGHLEMLFRGVGNIPSIRELNGDSQRVGLEFFLWPVEEGSILEVFVFPYLELLNRKEVFGVTQTKEEEITDWALCEQLWELVLPKVIAEFDATPLHERR